MAVTPVALTDFGARPDDGVDDSAAWRAFLAAVNRTGAGVIPAGEFELAKTTRHVLEWADEARSAGTISLRGAGRGRTVLDFGARGGTALSVDANFDVGGFDVKGSGNALNFLGITDGSRYLAYQYRAENADIGASTLTRAITNFRLADVTFSGLRRAVLGSTRAATDIGNGTFENLTIDGGWSGIHMAGHSLHDIAYRNITVRNIDSTAVGDLPNGNPVRVYNGMGIFHGANLASAQAVSKNILFEDVTIDGVTDRRPRGSSGNPNEWNPETSGVHVLGADGVRFTNVRVSNVWNAAAEDSQGIYLKASNTAADGVHLKNAGNAEASIAFKGAPPTSAGLDAKGHHHRWTNLTFERDDGRASPALLLNDPNTTVEDVLIRGYLAPKANEGLITARDEAGLGGMVIDGVRIEDSRAISGVLMNDDGRNWTVRDVRADGLGHAAAGSGVLLAVVRVANEANGSRGVLDGVLVDGVAAGGLDGGAAGATLVALDGRGDLEGAAGHLRNVEVRGVTTPPAGASGLTIDTGAGPSASIEAVRVVSSDPDPLAPWLRVAGATPTEVRLTAADPATGAPAPVNGVAYLTPVAYRDDAFRATNAPAYASGAHDPVLDTLNVALGGVDKAAVRGMSGGWALGFGLEAPGDAIVRFAYRMVASRGYEASETSEVLAAVDGVPLGQGGAIAAIAGDGDGGRDDSTGWRTATFRVSDLAAGRHELTLGGFVNAKTDASEWTKLAFKDVEVSATPVAAPVTAARRTLGVADLLPDGSGFRAWNDLADALTRDRDDPPAAALPTTA